MKIERAVRALSALAQSTRLSLYRALVRAGPDGLAAGDIAAALKVAPATLSFHLKELHHARLVAYRQAGRFVIYSANFDEMNALLSYLTEHCCRGEIDECLSVAELASADCCPPAPAKAARKRK